MKDGWPLTKGARNAAGVRSEGEHSRRGSTDAMADGDPIGRDSGLGGLVRLVSPGSYTM